MKLTPEEYRRGIVWWDHPDIEVGVSASDTDDPAVPVSMVIVPHSGAVAPVPLARRRGIHLRPKDGGVLPEHGLRVRWECASDRHHIVTTVWNERGQETGLSFVPNYGIYHRLLVHTPLLVGSEECVLRAGDVVVRLVEDTFLGQLTGTLDPATISAWEVPQVVGPDGSFYFQGRCAEIVAPGASGAEAELAAFAVLGYLATCMGDAVVGEIVFSEGFEVEWNAADIDLRVPMRGLTPQPIRPDVADALMLGFDAAAAQVATGGAVALALRWYEQGIRAEVPLDRLIACFFGVEAIVNAFAGDHGSLPVVQARTRERDGVLKLLEEHVDGPLLAQVKAQFRDPSASLLDAYTFYAEKRNVPSDLLDTFKMAKRLRNRAAHGGGVHVEVQQASDVRRLLGTILRTELGLAEVIRWEPSSWFLGARIRHHIDFASRESGETRASDDERAGEAGA